MSDSAITTKVNSIRSLGEFFNQPIIAALCQANSLTAGISTYFSGIYSQEQFETLTTFVNLLHSKLSIIGDHYIDKEFFDTEDGKRVIGKVFKGIIRDNREEKLEAMSNIAINIFSKSIISVDEREIYVDILDNLNALQLSILHCSVIEIRNRSGNKHRGIGWGIIFKGYEKQGITKPLFLQSMRTLESSGLINRNDAMSAEEDKTHFVTDFGEQFDDFISSPLAENPKYLKS